MFKKIIALSLTLALLAPIGAVQAADRKASTPTLEEILHEYHQKAFQEQATGISLCSDGKTLEEETVEALNNAGYEAYYVTGDNYKSLERTLQTDFSAMGMRKDSSYIVTFGIENPSGDKIEIDDGGLGGDGGKAYFSYIHNNIEYKMRYVTLTSANHSSDMIVNSVATLSGETWSGNVMENLTEIFLVGCADALSLIPFGTIATLLADSCPSNNQINLDVDQLVFHTITTWTCSLIQVYSEEYESWYSAQCSEYTYSQASAAGYLYNRSTNKGDFFKGPEHSIENYSEKYTNLTVRKADAVSAYLSGLVSTDFVSSVKFYLGTMQHEVLYTDEGTFLCEHTRSYPIPRFSS